MINLLNRDNNKIAIIGEKSTPDWGKNFLIRIRNGSVTLIRNLYSEL